MLNIVSPHTISPIIEKLQINVDSLCVKIAVKYVVALVICNNVRKYDSQQIVKIG